MLRDLCLVFEECRSAFDELEEALQNCDTGSFSPLRLRLSAGLLLPA